MKTQNHFLLFLFLLVILSFNSCSLVAGIFKAGMGVGIFIVVAIIGLLIYLVAKLSKK